MTESSFNTFKIGLFRGTDHNDAADRVAHLPTIARVKKTFDRYDDNTVLPALEVDTTMDEDTLVETLTGWTDWDGSTSQVNQAAVEEMTEPESTSEATLPQTTETVSDVVDQFLSSLDGPASMVDFVRTMFDPIADLVLSLVHNFGVDDVSNYLESTRTAFLRRQALMDVLESISTVENRSAHHKTVVTEIINLIGRHEQELLG